MIIDGFLSVAVRSLPAAPAATNLQHETSAVAVLAPTKGNSVSGTVNFTQKGDLVQIEAKINGLKPNGTHGIHIHEKGNCSAATPPAPAAISIRPPPSTAAPAVPSAMAAIWAI